MSDSISLKSVSTVWFDCFPTEIILEIFNYLSFSNIIHSFFHLNQRLKDLLLIHIRYNNHLQLPTTDLHFWQQVLPIIGSHIHSLTIINDYSPWSLDAFSHLRSITVSSPSGLANGQLKRILEHQCFPQLHTLKIRNELVFQPSYNRSECDGEGFLFSKVLSDKNNLQVFEYHPVDLDLCWAEHRFYRTTNVKLRSMTLSLREFGDILDFIKCTPNLVYLNIHSPPPFQSQTTHQWEKMIPIELEEFHLKLNEENDSSHNNRLFKIVNVNRITSIIQLFSSSLITLSLHFAFSDRYYDQTNFVFDGTKLQNQLLTSLIKLKHFHLFAETYSMSKDLQTILFTFRNQFWYDHHWSIGVHQSNKTYVYSLPFHFKAFDGLIEWNQVLSDNSQLLNIDSRLWYNVTSLGLLMMNGIDLKNVFRSIKLNMPKLLLLRFSTIKYPVNYNSFNQQMFEGNDHDVDVVLTRVTTVYFEDISIEQLKQCLIKALPSLIHLVLIASDLPSVDSELAPVFNKNIQRLEVGRFFNVRQLAECNYRYLSSLQELSVTISHIFNDTECEDRAIIITKLLNNFPNLKTLSIFIEPCDTGVIYSYDYIFKSIIKHVMTDPINDQYEIRRCGECLRFVRKLLTSI